MNVQFTQDAQGITITIPASHLQQTVEANPYHPVKVENVGAFTSEVIQELAHHLDNNSETCTCFQSMLNEVCFEAVINNNGKGARMIEPAETQTV